MDRLPTTPTSLETEVTNDESQLHSVALALGSNLGDRFANIETALRLLEIPRSLINGLSTSAQVSVVDTSFMYETAPMYVTNQPRFVNCACMVRLVSHFSLEHVHRCLARSKQTYLPRNYCAWSRKSRL